MVQVHLRTRSLLNLGPHGKGRRDLDSRKESTRCHRGRSLQEEEPPAAVAVRPTQPPRVGFEVRVPTTAAARLKISAWAMSSMPLSIGLAARFVW